MPPDASQLLERFGAFGLLAAALLWGGPKLISFMREQRQEFTSAIKEMRQDHAATIKEIVTKHETRLDIIYQTHERWQKSTNDVVSKLTERVSELVEHHRPTS